MLLSYQGMIYCAWLLRGGHEFGGAISMFVMNGLGGFIAGLQ